MKRTITLLLMAAAIITGCNNGPSRKELRESNDELKAELQEKDAAIAELISTMNSIDEGFRKINEIQGRINLNSATSEGQGSSTAAIERNIEYITSTLKKNKEEIESLKKQLLNNKQVSKELKAMAARLEQQLIDKSRELATLQQALADKDIHIGKLDSIISYLTRANTGQELQLIAQEEELNSVWYAIGTKSELKEQNILSGGDVMRENDVNFKYFTKADKRELNTINTYAKRAKLLTNHTEGSYTLERNEQKQYVLTITDPDSFWSTSRYLIIQVR